MIDMAAVCVPREEFGTPDSPFGSPAGSVVGVPGGVPVGVPSGRHLRLQPDPAVAAPAQDHLGFPTSDAPVVPSLALVPGPVAARTVVPVGWWLAAGAVVLMVLAGMVVAGMGPVAGGAPAPAPAVTAGSPVVPSSAWEVPAVYVVQPGDNLWAIAATITDGGDLRRTVDELSRRAGGSGLQVGQVINLDGLVAGR